MSSDWSGAVEKLASAQEARVDRSLRLLYGSYGAGMHREERKSAEGYGSGWLRGSRRKNYVCPKCGNGYSVVKSLKRHLRYECGVAPRFKCPYCGSRSKQKAHVHEHIRRKHSGQRIYIIDSP
ncbi:zinc finger X-chromosomal protein-like isoform X2 [Calliopsis andreniformis]|uniref:zinc finger X-chromosomal protein-like isoform X2 n=1 Tax=Calliopsis andreniformis TaxID=337506 RepID=UPI003FCD7435